ncbi:hypothetical protein ACOJR9_18455 [Alteromonas sp. A081]|uniref:hypothetical protein n=1 Tax=Alteromonas sp. A081 TaxID=3410269 RepID=UPI003B983972
MSDVSGVTLNSAFSAGQFGLQRASDGMTQAASNIAQQTAGRQQELGGTYRAALYRIHHKKRPLILLPTLSRSTSTVSMHRHRQKYLMWQTIRLAPLSTH